MPLGIPRVRAIAAEVIRTIRGLVLRPTLEDIDKALRQMPSQFERILYCERLYRGTYEDRAQDLISGNQQSTLGLRRAQLHCLREWVSLGLEQKMADLVLYLTNHRDDEKRDLFRFLRDQSSLMASTPSRCNSPERDLFFVDLIALLPLARAEAARQDLRRLADAEDRKVETTVVCSTHHAGVDVIRKPE